jgi:hypothetical protein
MAGVPADSSYCDLHCAAYGEFPGNKSSSVEPGEELEIRMNPRRVKEK